MKKTLVTVVSLMFAVCCFAQINGVSKDVVVSSNVEWVKASEKYEEWIYLNFGDYKGTYMKTFEQTPVGYKHAIDEIKELCSLNSKTISNPDQDNSLLPSYAENIYDYSNMNLGIKSGSGELKKVWQIVNDGKKGVIVLGLTKGSYTITALMK